MARQPTSARVRLTPSFAPGRQTTVQVADLEGVLVGHDGDVAAIGLGSAGPSEPAGTRAGAAGRAVAAAFGVDLAAAAAAERFTGKVGEVVRLPAPSANGLPPRLLVVGQGEGTPRELRRAGAALARAVRGRRHLISTLGDGSGSEGTRAVVEGLMLGGYTPPTAGRNRSDSAPVTRVTLTGRQVPGDVQRGALHASVTIRSRDLAETPSNVKTPQWVAERAAEVAAETGLDIDIWDADRLAAEGFGALCAVGGGSEHPPRLVRLDYRPVADPPDAGARRGRARAARPIVLVGKGITYDTGGISIKPRESMVPMKTDMSGSAAVLSTLAACAAAGVRRRVIGLLPLAENAVGASSYRPGDVVTCYGGRTVEVLNTDAEGRLVLADAMAYAVAALDPELIVDIATLTGAVTLGLGRRHAGLYGTDERAVTALERAGASSGELVWRMPLVEDYRPALDSPVADLRNVPTADAGVGGGSIVAALFLREFTAGLPWVHLDIAGTARSEKDEYEVTRGATGFGARLLLRWLEGLR